MITDSIGQLVNQSIGVNPNDRAIQANSPDTGFISMFFQTSALTVGMTKNGAITMRRTMFWPKICWSISSATRMPPTTLMTSTETTRIERVDQRAEKIGIGEESRVVLQADEAHVVRIEQVVVQRREIERHHQRHDHPEEEQDDRWRDQSAARGGGLLRRHRLSPSSLSPTRVDRARS